MMKGQVTWLLLISTVVQLLQAAPLEDSITAVQTVEPLVLRQVSEDETQEIPSQGEKLNKDSEESGEDNSDNADDDDDDDDDDRRKRSDDSYSRSSEEYRVKRQITNENSARDDESSEEFGEVLPAFRPKRRALDKSLVSKESKEEDDDSSDGVTKEKIVRRRSDEDSRSDDKSNDSDESDDSSDNKRRRSEEDKSSDSNESGNFSDKRKRREDTTTTSTTALPVILVAPADVPVKEISTAIKQDLEILKKKLDNFESKVDEGAESTIPSVGVLGVQDTPQDKDTVIHTISSAKYIVH